MPYTQTVKTDNNPTKPFAVIDDGHWRGIIAPKTHLSSQRLQMLIDDLEDSDPAFLAETHQEYHQAKKNNQLISSHKVKKLISKK